MLRLFDDLVFPPVNVTDPLAAQQPDRLAEAEPAESTGGSELLVAQLLAGDTAATQPPGIDQVDADCGESSVIERLPPRSGGKLCRP